MSAGASAAAPRQPGGQARAAGATQQPPTLRQPGGHRAGCQNHAFVEHDPAPQLSYPVLLGEPPRLR
eukprot:5222477-Alexandrium_andersonii.AAC.1